MPLSSRHEHRWGCASMHPLVLGIPTYFFMWGFALLVYIPLATHLARKDGFSVARASSALALLAVLLFAGAKALYLLEAAWYPLDEPVPNPGARLLHGFRIPGGVIFIALLGPLTCRLVGLPWRDFGDSIVPAGALAIALIRVGCFFNGCCFGATTSLPWGLSFPRGSNVHWYHAAHGWIPAAAGQSLPVHPLQLYFVTAAAATTAALFWIRRHQLPPGRGQLIFYALFFGTTAFLEPLRASPLTLNGLLVPAASLGAAGLILGQILANGTAMEPTVGASRNTCAAQTVARYRARTRP